MWHLRMRLTETDKLFSFPLCIEVLFRYSTIHYTVHLCTTVYLVDMPCTVCHTFLCHTSIVWSTTLCTFTVVIPIVPAVISIYLQYTQHMFSLLALNRRSTNSMQVFNVSSWDPAFWLLTWILDLCSLTSQLESYWDKGGLEWRPLKNIYNFTSKSICDPLLNLHEMIQAWGFPCCFTVRALYLTII